MAVDMRSAFDADELASPEEVGLDSARLERVSEWMCALVAAKHLPCASVAVARRGKVVYCKGAGTQSPADPKRGPGGAAALPTPLSASTLYRIYSMSKPITSVALMMLHEEGRFLLDHPVHLFLGPAWKRGAMRVWDAARSTVEAPVYGACESSITVKQLLTHTSGLCYGFPGGEKVNPVDGVYQRELLKGGQRKNRTLAQFVDALAAMPLAFQPGTRWNYSYATDVCGRLVEVISGVPLGRFLRERIFAPLRMADTAFSVAAAVADARLAAVYFEGALLEGGRAPPVVAVPEAAAAKPAAAARPPPTVHSAERAGGLAFGKPPPLSDVSALQRRSGEFTPAHAMESGGGGLLSTTADYFRFAQCMASGGAHRGTRILSRKTVEWCTSNHLPGGQCMTDMGLPGFSEITTPGTGFGLGFSVVGQSSALAGDMASPGSFAWGGAASTVFWVDPKEELVVIFMTQVLGLNRQRLPVRSLLANIISGAIVDEGAKAERPQRASSRL